MKTLDIEHVIDIHEEVLSLTGGLVGLSQDKSLEAALKRINNYDFYENVSDVHEIAALYGIALAQGHLFIDGNKRTALIAMYNFLELNNYRLIAPENETVEIMVQIANKELNRTEVADWLKKNSIAINQ